MTSEVRLFKKPDYAGGNCKLYPVRDISGKRLGYVKTCNNVPVRVTHPRQRTLPAPLLFSDEREALLEYHTWWESETLMVPTAVKFKGKVGLVFKSRWEGNMVLIRPAESLQLKMGLI